MIVKVNVYLSDEAKVNVYLSNEVKVNVYLSDEAKVNVYLSDEVKVNAYVSDEVKVNAYLSDEGKVHVLGEALAKGLPHTQQTCSISDRLASMVHRHLQGAVDETIDPCSRVQAIE